MQSLSTYEYTADRSVEGCPMAKWKRAESNIVLSGIAAHVLRRSMQLRPC